MGRFRDFLLFLYYYKHLREREEREGRTKEAKTANVMRGGLVFIMLWFARLLLEEGIPMVIVSGRIYVRPGTRDDFLKLSTEAVVQARRSTGCLDFVVAADPIEPDRVNVYEEWESEQALVAFRGDGPGADLSSMIVKANVIKHAISSSGRP
jgi:hypothetical protein